MRIPRLRIADPGLSSLKSATRAAIVMPAVFALSVEVIKEPQTAIFAAFGSVAMLVLVDFGGPVRSRLTAYLTLAVTGAILVVLGTLCSRNAWLAAAAMAVVGLVILSARAISGYFAAGATAALLPFILPVSFVAPPSAIGWRLAGWGLAAAASVGAAMLLWPPRRVSSLRAGAAQACRALGGLAEVVLAGDRPLTKSRATAAAKAVGELRGRFDAASHRPTVPTGQAAGLAALVDELSWLLGLLQALADTAATVLCRAENGETMAAAAAVLRASAARLDGRDEQPDSARLEAAQEAVVAAMAGQVAGLPPSGDDDELESLLGRSFRARTVGSTARQVASYALAASGTDPGQPRGAAALRQLAGEHAGTRSVLFRNSVRGAAGLAVAVFIAQRAGLQHSFWVVLATLSVLRSNALSTSRSVLGALAGTAAGIVVGAVILLGLGSSAPLLWGVLPVAVLAAAYAPRVISFAVGQAAFTVVILMLFNIIQPLGWEVGLIRFEDVGIGFAVSLGVGLVFWPRGAATVLRENMATAYSRGADFVAVTARRLAGRADAGDPRRAEQSAVAAVHLLDDAFHQYLTERPASREDPESSARLVAGAARLLRAGRSMEELSGATADGGPDGTLGRYGETLDGQVQALRSWYVTLGDSLTRATSVPPPQPADPRARARLLQYVREAVAGGDAAALRGALLALWASQHLDALRRMEAHLGAQAAPAPGHAPRAATPAR